MRTSIFANEVEVAPLVHSVIKSDMLLNFGSVERHPVIAYLAGLAPASQRTMRAALRAVARLVHADLNEMTVPWTELTYAHSMAIRAQVAERFAPATANRLLAAVRGVLRAAFKLGVIDAEQLARATSFDPVRGSRLPTGRALSHGEVGALFAVCPKSKQGARDAALLAFLFGCGLRRSEAVALDVQNVDRTTGAVIVNGKGRKQRKVYLTGGGRAAVDAWFAVRGEEPGPLLLPVNKADRIESRRLCDQAVAAIVRRLAERAKVGTTRPHDLRRSYASMLLDSADVMSVQALLGHSSPATTQRYDLRGERARERAASMIHVPYKG